MTLATTILTEEDGVKITIPKKHIVGEIIHNSFQYKIVENMVRISYSNDPESDSGDAKSDHFPEVAQTPRPQVGLQEFGESSINIGCRYWIPATKYFLTMCAINLAIHKALLDAKITIPFPQRDVHMISGTAAAK